MAPALEREVNLSRRACRITNNNNHNNINNINNNPSQVNKIKNGAKLITLNFNNYKNNKISENYFHSQFNCKNNINLSDKNIMCSSIIDNINKNIDSNKKRNEKCNIKKYNNRNKMSIMFIIINIILLLFVDNVNCRPNKSATTSANIDENVVVSNTASTNGFNLGSGYPQRELSSGELHAPYPGLAFDPMGQLPQTQGKRSAEISSNLPATTTISTGDTQNDGNSNQNMLDGQPVGTDTAHHAVERYPVASVEFERVETPFIIGIWILSASIAKIGFHMTPKLNKIFPESCLLIVVGVIIGIVLYFATSVHISPLTPNTFFFYMLPPIILDAGYFMPNRLFFDNIGTILLMAVIGTIFNIATIGSSLYACGLTGMFYVDTPILDIFLFSSLISAVDPVAVLAVFEEIHVNEILYIVVFGESLLNDAVTVVLYHMFEAYNGIGISNINTADVVSGVASFFVVAVGGTIIGVIWGFLTGLVTRFTDHVRVIEPIFIFVMAYLAYLNAEIFHMSGILAITFCGITMKNYVEANISNKSHTTVKYALKMLSSSAETIIFMFLGVATVNNRHVWNTWFILLTILFCSVYRIIGVIILTAIANRFRLHKLSNVDQFVMSYGGLRGAVAFALVLLIDEKHVPLQPMFVTTTIAVIYFTVFLQGITIKPLVKLLKVKRANKKKPSMNERIHERFMDHLMAGIEDIVGKTGNYNVRDKFKRFDNRFIRPYLIRDLQIAEPKILETYSKLTMRDAMDFMRRNPSTIGQMSGTESMSALFRNYTTGYFGGRFGNSFFTTCPSFNNLENCSRNLDMHELDYNPSKKDLTDARIHHLLAEELKPYRRHRRLSYSRHAVDDRDLSTQVNYRMHMNIRRMVNDRKHHKRSKRLNKDGSKQNHVSFPEFQQNGSAKQLSHGTNNHHHNRKSKRKHSHRLNKYRRLELDYINEVLNEGNEEEEQKNSPNSNEDWDNGGLTFTAKPSPDDDQTNNNSLIAHISNLPGFDPSKARFVKHYSTAGGTGSTATTAAASNNGSDTDDMDNTESYCLPTAAEIILPWRRSYHNFGEEVASEKRAESKRFSKDSEGEERVTTPTATESVLPWKRGDEGDEENGAVKQNEFPAWASNKEYLAYNSPSATFLGGLSKPKQAKSVIGLFRRESAASGSTGIAVAFPTAVASGLAGITTGGGSGMHSGVGTSSTGSDSSLQLSGIVIGTPTNRAHNDKRSASVCGSLPLDDTTDPLGVMKGPNAGPFPVTASHRRNNRRGSMLELSGDPIPEEIFVKSLPERDSMWTSESTATTNHHKKASSGSPLLKMTPKAQIRRMNPQSTALLSPSSSESESDDDDDEDAGLSMSLGRRKRRT